jgi:hypothetical protein
VFITPEKFTYVESASPLRRLLSSHTVDELWFLPEDTFGDLVTYPLVTTISKGSPASTTVISRDGDSFAVQLSNSGESWRPAISRAPVHHGVCLSDISIRISCGVATGADDAFLVANAELPEALKPFSYPTISGRQLVPGKKPESTHRLLVPYDANGALLSERSLGSLRKYLEDPRRKTALLKRTCVRRKPWYAFHENPPLRDILRPKLLCKDIGASPHFFVDSKGSIVPRHSVYYIVPRNPTLLGRLGTFLNSTASREWLIQHCQRAAGGFVRLQSHVLKRLPLDASFEEQRFLVAEVPLDVPITASR